MGTRERKTPRERVAKILMDATPKAARILVQTLKSDEGTHNAKIDCAKEILNRVYGKSSIASEETEERKLSVVMEQQAQEEAV